MEKSPSSSATTSNSTTTAANTEPVLQSRRALYVGGLSEQVNETTLRAAMIPFGPIKSIDIPMDYTKGTHKGFAFVEYQDADDAAEAQYNLDGGELHGRTLKVNLAQQQSSRMIQLGGSKSIWSTDEWFREQSGGSKGDGAHDKGQNLGKGAEMDVEALKENNPVSG